MFYFSASGGSSSGASVRAGLDSCVGGAALAGEGVAGEEVGGGEHFGDPFVEVGHGFEALCELEVLTFELRGGVGNGGRGGGTLANYNNDNNIGWT